MKENACSDLHCCIEWKMFSSNAHDVICSAKSLEKQDRSDF